LVLAESRPADAFSERVELQMSGRLQKAWFLQAKSLPVGR
jgi:hypothetical protein